ncbi:phosphoribosylformylglycinamidine synthase [Friedmanniomyces endolithicus]|nr:phosphoribosylformylglycinamidine synthase [Friedmanniomyces endolithicus]KAK1006861.1 phosphoribosylformylglycinamidine synthase [Friedmanniomyces endolithicus]
MGSDEGGEEIKSDVQDPPATQENGEMVAVRADPILDGEESAAPRPIMGASSGSLQPQITISPTNMTLGNLHKRRASTSPEKFNLGKFEPLPLRLNEDGKRPAKRPRTENKLEISYGALGTPRVTSITPMFTLPSGRKISGSQILNPDFPSATKKPFSMLDAFMRDNDLLVQLISYFPIPSIIDLYSISRGFHFLFNGSYLAFVLANMRTWAPNADKIYPWRWSPSLCQKDPRLRQKSSAVGKDVEIKYQDMRDTPTLKWLQMVVWRQGVCKDMLIQLATKGLRCPPGTLDAISRMWFVMDMPLNTQRVALVRNEEYISNKTIFNATLFFLKVDMSFTDPEGPLYPINGPGMNPAVHLPQLQNTGLVGCSLRALLTAERHFTSLWRVLRGVCPDPDEPMFPIERLDVLRLWIRHKYRVPDDTLEHVKRQSILGIPWQEVGVASLERTGVAIYTRADGTQGTIINPAVTSEVNQATHLGQQLLYPYQKRLLVPTQKPREVLLRPEELMLRESVRRKMRLHTQWSRMMLWGFCDDLGKNYAVRSEEELLSWSRGKEPLSLYQTDKEVLEARETARKKEEGNAPGKVNCEMGDGAPQYHHRAFPGSATFSDFRLRRLAAAVGAKSLQAIWVHYVASYHPLQAEQVSILDQILEYGSYPETSDSHYAALRKAVISGASTEDSSIRSFYVTPRAGTISPWSSKATSITHVCGLEKAVHRVERGFVIAAEFDQAPSEAIIPNAEALYDRMTESFGSVGPDMKAMFEQRPPAPLERVHLLQGSSGSKETLKQANVALGLALDDSEMDYLIDAYTNQLQRDPTDVELFMFAQVNSEHCRHKQFNADWTIDGASKSRSLFSMIRNTHDLHPKHVISAYSDNAAVLQGYEGGSWAPEHSTGEWKQTKETVHYLAKVETHNHPTAVSPFPGAATGSGGEIRDEGAVGRGSKPKAGLSGFTVSDLLIPDHRQPWELDVGKPKHLASSLEIMLQAPLGSASFNNEFGRPCTTGYFRTLTTSVPTPEGKSEIRGYHKPIMIAGGVGTVRPQHAIKEKGLVSPGAHLIVIGGPAMLIGLGGGAASSKQSGEGSVQLDFASVQRGNAEVQRRAQEVINTCCSLGAQNPIQFIHDVGAGGLSNALPELVEDAGYGAHFELREVDSADKSLSPLQIWCNEAQERYVMAIAPDKLDVFLRIAKRERCGYSVVGKANKEKRLVLTDRDSKDEPTPIDLPMSVLFGKPPKMHRVVDSRRLGLPAFDSTLTSYLPKIPSHEALGQAITRVLALPAVGSKSFLITIADRTVGGMTVRDQMVGPWQTPVADVSVTATSLTPGIRTGEAMSMGEKPTLALISPAASARMAVAESLMNIAAAGVDNRLSRIRLSANWMAASSHPGEGAALYEAVEAIGMQLCPELGISIPVGKDSMSMKTKWEGKEVTAPLSLIVTAFAPVNNIGSTWTPTLRRQEEVGETLLMFVDLAEGKKALGGSALAQVFGQVGNQAPDIRDVDLIKDFYHAIEQLHESDIVLAYHDRSDGGLLTTLVEMMFAGRCGLDVMLDNVVKSGRTQDLVETLFNEELGAVFQIRKKHENEFRGVFAPLRPVVVGVIPKASKPQDLSMYYGADCVYRESRKALQQKWSQTSWAMQRLRDNPECADAEKANIDDDHNHGLRFKLTFNPAENIMSYTTSFSSQVRARPRVAILREQGVNGQAEMAFAFASAGFSPIDVHMTDILSGRFSLASVVGLAACGGFSYGDVLGAGQGWAKSVLLHEGARREFKAFFERKDTFTLGVCNGCQFLSRLTDIIPGAEAWPTFERNVSEQYEARVCMVEVHDPPGQQHPQSVFLHGMHGSHLPIVTAHGEGRAEFPSTGQSSAQALVEQGLVSLRYTDNHLQHTERYPYNPNGSPMGITGVRTPDGRVLALMPHPERTILRDVGSFIPEHQAREWGEFGPWIRLFKSARRWCG